MALKQSSGFRALARSMASSVSGEMSSPRPRLYHRTRDSQIEFWTFRKSFELRWPAVTNKLINMQV